MVLNTALTQRLLPNKTETKVTPEQFAARLVAELDLPEKLEYFIANSIRRQLADYLQLKTKATQAEQENICFIRVRTPLLAVLFDQQVAGLEHQWSGFV